MKLSTWAKNNEMTYQTAWNLFKAGKLPVKAYKLPTGTIIIENDELSRDKLLKEIKIFCEKNYTDDMAKIKIQECNKILK